LRGFGTNFTVREHRDSVPAALRTTRFRTRVRFAAARLGGALALPAGIESMPYAHKV
jgi:hypothetical protein